MKNLVKKNLLFFVFFVLIPYLVSLLYNRYNAGEFVATLQYVVLFVIFVGGLLVISINTKYIVRNRKDSLVIPIIFIALGVAISISSAFIALLQYSLRGGIGF